MIEGINLQELAAQVESRRAITQDFRVPNRQLRAGTNGDHPAFFVERPASRDRDGQDPIELRPSARFNSQVATALHIPKVYYDRMAASEPHLLAANVNTWLERTGGDTHLVRTFSASDGPGTARAFLGKAYRVIDAFDMLGAVMPVLAEMHNAGLRTEIKSAKVTEENLYLQVVFPELSAEIKRGPGHYIRAIEDGDVVQAGAVIRTNETGSGVAAIETLIFRQVCDNGLVMEQSVRRRHTGVRRTVEMAEQIDYRSDTLAAEGEAIRLQMRDALTAAREDATFAANVAKLSAAAGQPISDKHPEAVVEVVANRHTLSDDEGRSMLRHLIEGGDWSKWGVVNAVTAVANDRDDYDRAVELEKLGGKVLDMDPRDWRVIETAALEGVAA